MTRTTRQIMLGITAALMLTLLIAFLATPAIARDPVRPREVNELARWLADHPADWLAASGLSARALDSTLPARHALWRRSYEHAQRLAPRRLNGTSAFVRGGLFHWYELEAADRKEILAVAAPMLRDPKIFTEMHKPLWELTRDLGYLRRNAPDTENAIVVLRDLAATNGLFDDYRELRTALSRHRMKTFESGKERLTAVELIRLIPSPITRDEEPLVRRVLDQLQRRPLDASNAASVHQAGSDLAEYAIRHRLGPLDGLEVLVETREVPAASRARLAEALGRTTDAKRIAVLESRQPSTERWSGTCGRNEVCYSATATIPADRQITLDVAVVQTDEIPAYIEIYVDDERMAEGPVVETRRFAVPVRTAGAHRVEVRIANPHTRNQIQRRIRLS